MFKDNNKEKKEKLVRLYFLFKKFQRFMLAACLLLNFIFFGFVVGEGLGVSIIFLLNLYVAAWGYWIIRREDKKKEKEKNPDV